MIIVLSLLLLILKTNHAKNLKFIEILRDALMNSSLALKNKEFLILKKLCDNSISQTDKEKFEKQLEETRLEIEKLR